MDDDLMSFEKALHSSIENGLLFLLSGNVSLLDVDHYADVFRKALPDPVEILYTAIEEVGPKRISVWCY